MNFIAEIHGTLSGALPETIIYDREGSPVRTLTGEQTYEQFVEAVSDVL